MTLFGPISDLFGAEVTSIWGIKRFEEAGYCHSFNQHFFEKNQRYKHKTCKKNKQTRQVCEVCWSNVLQGVDAHIERFSTSISLDKSGPVLKPVEVGPVGTTLPKFNRNTMAFPPWLSGASC